MVLESAALVGVELACNITLVEIQSTQEIGNPTQVRSQKFFLVSLLSVVTNLTFLILIELLLEVILAAYIFQSVDAFPQN